MWMSEAEDGVYYSVREWMKVRDHSETVSDNTEHWWWAEERNEDMSRQVISWIMVWLVFKNQWIGVTADIHEDFL